MDNENVSVYGNTKLQNLYVVVVGITVPSQSMNTICRNQAFLKLSNQ